MAPSTAPCYTRALQESVEFRAGYSLEYCAMTMVDLHAQMKQAALDIPTIPKVWLIVGAKVFRPCFISLPFRSPW